MIEKLQAIAILRIASVILMLASCGPALGDEPSQFEFRSFC